MQQTPSDARSDWGCGTGVLQQERFDQVGEAGGGAVISAVLRFLPFTEGPATSQAAAKTVGWKTGVFTGTDGDLAAISYPRATGS